ncbi:hypothetical protein JL721_10376 [Aureococcus anophagefferens]|nr:hypothetical protein JL721_10376 [Aureococcus anophagefferens]
MVETLKETFAAEVASGAVLVASPQLDAYADPTSPFLAAHTNVKLVGGPATLGAVLPWALRARVERRAPYHDEAEAFLVAYAAYHVPAGRLAEVLSAAMALKAAAGNGIYNVDLLLAPLTGDAKADYGAAALKGGSDWRMNAAALSA